MPSLGNYANAFLFECDTLIAENISGNLLNKDLSINSLELNEKWKIYLDDSSNFILKNEIIDVVSLSGNAITGNITFKGQETDFKNYDDASFGNVDISGVLNLQNGLLTIDNSYGLQYQVLMSNGENNSVFWNTLPEGVEYFAGTDMSLVGTTFNNTAPDQVVTLTEGSNITITGIYPNFTISGSDTNTTYQAGTDLSLVGTTFNNTAPDQVVTLTEGSNITITGTYPNFTISGSDTNTTYQAGTDMSLVGTTFNNTAPDQVVTLTGTGTSTVTGTYPNFTINSTGVNLTNYHDASFENVDISGVLNLQNGLLTIDNSYGSANQVLMSGGANNSVFWDTLPAGTQYFAGTDLSLVGNTFNNTAPDQVVTLTQAGNITITGTYPNFTISGSDTNTTYQAGTDMSLVGTTFNNTAPDQVVTLTDGSNITITGTYPNFTITTDLNNYVDASFGNVDISGNLDISNGVINFFASDEVLIGANTGILQRLEDLSNNLLISYNDASFNNVELSGNLYINGVSGVSGEVLRSQGSTSSPIWASIGVTNVLNNNSTYNSVGSIELSNNTTLIYNRPDVQTYFAGIQVNNNFSNTSRNSLSFTNQIQSGITTTSSGFTSTKLGWYNLTYNFTTNASQVFAYSYIWIVKSGTDYFRSAVRDQGYPYEYEANHGGGMLIFLLIGDTITFSTQADSGSYNINGFASLLKM